MSRHGDASRFRGVFELTMTSHSGDQKPTIISEKLEDITALHRADIIGESIENQKPYNV